MRFIDDTGQKREIDFLSNMMGLETPEVAATAPAVIIQGQPVAIMHPVLCILGRVPLICDLGRADADTLRQLR
ncbi:MAG TPA: hypothetical protein VG944_22860, partial [Fimbriimonas sp.]|nr:hypothetical protein [Fimbriimonas sp.]